MAGTTGQGRTGDAGVDGLLSGFRWSVPVLSFSFPGSASPYGLPYGNGEPQNNFEALSPVQRQAVRSVLGQFSSVANLAFPEITETATQHADLRFGMSDAPSTAWAYLPTPLLEGGDVWFNNSRGSYDSPVKGNYAYLTFIHEIGHALGLKHPHETEGYGAMPATLDAMETTAMSYRSFVGASSSTGYVNEVWGFAQSLMAYDIAALQRMYGANYATNAGDTTYRWNPSTGEMSVNGSGQGVPGGNRIFQTVWDGGGNDTYDFSGYSTNLRVDLRPGEWTTAAASQVARLKYDGSQTAKGNIANALQFNGDARSLIENAVGGAGNDSIVGNAIANALYGGAGEDRITGGAGDDLIDGGAGDDLIDGGAGDDLIDGGAGLDTSVYGGLRAQYEVRRLPDGSVRVADMRGPSYDGADVAWNVEAFAFADRTYSASELLARTSLTTLAASFDRTGYLWANPDVAAAGVDPLAHFMTYGIAEGRAGTGLDPLRTVGRTVDRGFDKDFYLIANPDVAAAGVEARQHYDAYGWWEGRDPNAAFDTSRYLDVYRDVAAAGVNPLDHYMRWGANEGRDPSAGFATTSYLDSYRDVAAAGVNPLEHYLRYGIYEGRSTWEVMA